MTHCRKRCVIFYLPFGQFNLFYHKMGFSQGIICRFPLLKFTVLRRNFLWFYTKRPDSLNRLTFIHFISQSIRRYCHLPKGSGLCSTTPVPPQIHPVQIFRLRHQKRRFQSLQLHPQAQHGLPDSGEEL